MSLRALAVLISAGLLGCQNAAVPSRPLGQSLGAELKQQDDQLVGQRFRTLLDFETDADAVFTHADSDSRRTSPGHTGRGALFAGQGVTFKIDPLLYGTHLPADWTLLGVYVRPADDETVTAELSIDGRSAATFSRNIAGGGWAFVGIDLTTPQLLDQLKSANHVTLHVTASNAEYDDVLLVDNTRTLVPASSGGWQIAQRGSRLRVTRPDGTGIDLPLAAAARDGFSIDEIGPLRMCLHSGENYFILMPDGRQIANGKISFLDPQPSAFAAALMRSHESPAALEVDEACGRLDRDTPGDANNDGYNERLGAYQIATSGRRLAAKIVPVGMPMQSPLLDVKGLAPGKLTVMVEGKLIDTVSRLPNGRVLILLPILIDRATEITVRVSDNQ